MLICAHGHAEMNIINQIHWITMNRNVLYLNIELKSLLIFLYDESIYRITITFHYSHVACAYVISEYC